MGLIKYMKAINESHAQGTFYHHYVKRVLKLVKGYLKYSLDNNYPITRIYYSAFAKNPKIGNGLYMECGTAALNELLNGDNTLTE